MNLTQLSGIDDAQAISLQLATRLTEHFFKDKLLTFAELEKSITPKELVLVDWIRNLKPEDLGLYSFYYGLEEPTPDIEFVPVNTTRTITKDDGSIKTYQNTDHIPKHVWEDWHRMQQLILEETGEEIVINSGYRSPAYQTLVFCYHLNGGLDPLDAVKRSAIPGYSQHSLTRNTAIDIALINSRSEEFDETLAYLWMLENADRFNFVLTYPLANEEGMDFEPWHWQWQDIY